jgi:hypothetical protein
MTDRNALLLTGNLLPFLNFGFGNIINKVNGGILDLSFDGDERITTSYEITATITLPSGDTRTTTRILNIKSGTDKESKIMYNDGMFSGDEYSNNELATVLNARTSALGDLLSLYSSLTGNFTGGLGVIVLSIADLAFGQEMSSRARITQYTFNVMASKLSMALVSKISNIAGASVLSQVTLSLGVFGVVTEAVEVALGLDKNFGYGGDPIGYDNYGNMQFAENFGLGTFAIDALGNTLDFLSFGAFGYMDAYDIARARLEDYNSIEAELFGTSYFDNSIGTMEYNTSYDRTSGSWGWSEDYSTFVGYDGMGTWEEDLRSVGLQFTANEIQSDYGGFDPESPEGINYKADKDMFGAGFAGYNSGGVEGYHNARMNESGGDDNDGGCFPYNTIVSCIDGDKKIIDIKSGDVIVSKDGNYKVLDLFEYNYSGKLYCYNGLYSTGGHTIYTDKLMLMADAGTPITNKYDKLYNLAIEDNKPFIANGVLVDSSIFTSYYLYNNGYISKEEYFKDQRYTVSYESDYDLALGYRYIGRLWLCIAKSSHIGALIVSFFARRWIKDCDKENKSIVSTVGLYITRMIGKLIRT